MMNNNNRVSKERLLRKKQNKGKTNFPVSDDGYIQKSLLEPLIMENRLIMLHNSVDGKPIKSSKND